MNEGTETTTAPSIVKHVTAHSSDVVSTDGRLLGQIRSYPHTFQAYPDGFAGGSWAGFGTLRDAVGYIVEARP